MLRRIFMDVESVPPPEERRPLIRPDIVRKFCRRSGLPFSREDEVMEAGAGLCTDEQFRRLALHAEYGRVLAIGLVVEHDRQVEHYGLLGRERPTGKFHLDERRTLRAFWKLLQDFNVGRDLIVGHNILDFDLPFLYKRSRINRIHPSILFSFARYRSAPVYDTMREWAHWNPHAPLVTLDQLADILGVGLSKTEGMDGSRVYDEYLAGHHDRVAAYCLRDVEIARAIYYRMVFPEGPAPQELTNSHE
jgi:3'-5' exonuclease